MSATTLEKLYSIRTGAEALGIGQTTFRRLIREGKIRSIRVGDCIKIPESFLADFIASGGAR